MNNIIIHPLHQIPPVTNPSPAKAGQPGVFDDLLAGYVTQLKSQHTPAATPESDMFIGEITHETPTVSELLMQHKELRSSTWDIIYSEQNKNKDYTRIQPGTRIYYSSNEGALRWSTSGRDAPSTEQAAALPRPAPRAPEPHFQNSYAQKNSARPAGDLSEAVQRYIGTSYDKMNCYELLVTGLRQMDIPYSGKNGLFKKLTRMAADRGMAPNAYLNGEGIVKAAGSLVLSNNYPAITNWQDDAAALISEIEPLLDTGQILSFSTEKRGHTGVVSQQNNQWTFINSGRLDNPVVSNSVRHGVGEEILHEEIRNWFKLAQAKKETLRVTLGRLEQEKIHAAVNVLQSSVKRT